MSRLSRAIHHVTHQVHEHVTHAVHTAERIGHHGPLGRQVSHAANVGKEVGRHVLAEAKRAAHEVGRIHVEVHEHLPGIRAAERFLIRAAIRGQKAGGGTWTRIGGKIAAAGEGLKIQQEAAFSTKYSHERGITARQQRLARAHTILLAASVAAGAVASAVVAPAVAAAVAASAEATGITGAGVTIGVVGASPGVAAAAGVEAAGAASALGSVGAAVPLVNIVAGAVGEAAGGVLSNAVNKLGAPYEERYTRAVYEEAYAEYEKAVAEAVREQQENYYSNPEK